MAHESEPSGSGGAGRTEKPPVGPFGTLGPAFGYLLSFVVSGTVFGLLMYVMPGNDEDPSVAGAVVSGLFFGAFMTAAMAFIWRKQTKVMRSHTKDERQQISAALRKGRLPDDPGLDGDARDLSVRTRDQMRANRRLAPVLFGLLALLGIGLAVGNRSWIWAGYAVFFVVAGVLTIIGARHTERRLTDLERRIDERADPSAAAISAG